MLLTLAQRSKLLKAQVRLKRTEVAQKLLPLSETYSASTNVPSFSALWWLARLLNVLMGFEHHSLTHANKRDHSEETNWVTS